MSLDRLNPKAVKRISGPAWAPLRHTIEQINAALLSVSPGARGDLATIYIKYTGPETGDQPYAVLWVKKSIELILGLAGPAGAETPGMSGPLPGYIYPGLTRYIRIPVGGLVPAEFKQWAAEAYEVMAAAVCNQS